MKELDVQQRTYGINFDEEGQAHIAVWAPKGEDVSLRLKDGKNIALDKAPDGYWEKSTTEIRPGDLYKIMLNAEMEFPDPASLSQPEGVHGYSQAIDLSSFHWQENEWNNIPLEHYIIYELHTGTFSESGTFSGIEERLDHLQSLGITAIEIMPVAQFPGARNWGYDGVFPYAVQNSYGGARGLQSLVAACHDRGIAVILDVVYNHMGPEGNYLDAYGPYFTGKYNTPWGMAINFDDAWSDGVRRYMIENVLMWFRDFRIDALRLDAVHAIKDLGPRHILRDIKEAVDKLMEETGRVHYLTVECDLNDTRFIDPVSKNGLGMDAQWIDEFHHSLRVTAGQEQTGYYADFNGISHLAKAYKDAYVYDGQYSPHRHKKFGTKATDNPGRQFIVFSQNHDQIGNRMLGERISQLVSFEMHKLMAGAVLTSPYLPMLFMGEEYAEPNPFLYFISHTDADLVAAVQKGRKAEFAAFNFSDETPDPQSEDTFRRSKQQWHLLSEAPYSTMLQYYKTLISLRKKLPPLATLNRNQLDVSFSEEKNTLALHRWHEGVHALCLMNFSQAQQRVHISGHSQHWHKLLDSAAPQWNGPEAAPDKVSGGEDIILQPESIIIYTNADV